MEWKKSVYKDGLDLASRVKLWGYLYHNLDTVLIKNACNGVVTLWEIKASHTSAKAEDFVEGGQIMSS